MKKIDAERMIEHVTRMIDGSAVDAGTFVRLAAHRHGNAIAVEAETGEVFEIQIAIVQSRNGR